jgi:hypothetical protein
MSFRFLSVVFVVFLVFLAGAKGLRGIEHATNDWLRGSGKELEICLKGKVLGPDGQPAKNFKMMGGIRSYTLRVTKQAHNRPLSYTERVSCLTVFA